MLLSESRLLIRIIDTKDYSIISKNNLVSEYFRTAKAEFEFIKNHYESYGSVPDKVTFLKTFPMFEEQCGGAWLDVKETNEYLIDQLELDYQIAVVAQGFNKAKKLLESSDESSRRAGIELVQNISKDIKTISKLPCVDLFADKSRYEKYLEKANNTGLHYIMTGFPELDAITGGIDAENENMIIAARTGIGKSWMLLIMAATAACQGLNVGVYSGEMTADKVGYRVDTILSHVNNTNITRGNLFEKSKYESYINNLKDFAESYMNEKYPNLCNSIASNGSSFKLGTLKIVTPNDLSCTSSFPTVDQLESFVDDNNINILFIDQYSLLDDNSSSKVEHERVANISKAVKRLQVKKHIPMISVTQLNRSKNDDGSRDSTQIALSDRIGQDATTIIILDRDKETNELTLNIDKARDGGDGKSLRYAADFNEGRFRYIEEGNDTMLYQDYEESEAMEQRYS